LYRLELGKWDRFRYSGNS